MTEAIIVILGISLLLYVLLGGADFGAGIVEMLIGKKGTGTISKAIAPVWEANHIWIILAIVILFNGFPLAYSVMSTFLHIPLLLMLIGIIIRGTAFTFRYYDVPDGNMHKYYSWLFRISSLFTPFFLGIVLGAIILGRIPGSADGNFNELFIKPWLNIFTVSTGIFLILLFGWIASVYLIGETQENTFAMFARTSRLLFVLLIASGLGVFIAAESTHLHLFRKFSHSPVSIGCVIIATVLIPFLWRNISHKNVLWSRLLAGIETACILVGWFAVQFPVLISRSDGNHLTVWNTHAPDATLYYLLAALIVGIFIILPAFAFLFKVFKFR